VTCRGCRCVEHVVTIVTVQKSPKLEPDARVMARVNEEELLMGLFCDWTRYRSNRVGYGTVAVEVLT